MNIETTNGYPRYVLITPSARDAIKEHTLREFRRAGTETGGLLHGTVFRHPNGGTVPVIVQATPGICQATRIACEILPESWAQASRELDARGIGHLVNLGDYHSHPALQVFLSTDDIQSFWAYGHVAHWLSLVTDPVREEYGVFSKCSPTDLWRVPTFVIGSAIQRALRLPQDETAPETLSAAQVEAVRTSHARERVNLFVSRGGNGICHEYGHHSS